MIRTVARRSAPTRPALLTPAFVAVLIPLVVLATPARVRVLDGATWMLPEARRELLQSAGQLLCLLLLGKGITARCKMLLDRLERRRDAGLRLVPVDRRTIGRCRRGVLAGRRINRGEKNEEGQTQTDCERASAREHR